MALEEGLISFKTESKLRTNSARVSDVASFVNGKEKQICYHHIIVKMFIKKDFNSKVEEVDHRDHNRTNNSIENLAVVSRSDNIKNMSKEQLTPEYIQALLDRIAALEEDSPTLSRRTGSLPYRR